MRLRLTVRRHGLPDTPVVWVVDTSSSPTISQLLEAVNEAIPIESDNEWGLEDYAVELKGANGANYECLHYQHVATVMKEDDEVIIRPLLTLDLKRRRVSGRDQISGDGKHLYDGVAFGRPLLRRADRPPITIPPRKRRRILQQEEEDDDDEVEDVPALMEREEDTGAGADADADADKQLVLHADFDDEDSEDDDDFVPGGEGDDEADGSSDDDMAEDDIDQISNTGDIEGEAEEQASGSQIEDEDAQSTANMELEVFQESPAAPAMEDDDEAAFQKLSEAQRANIRKLHAIFPKSPIAVCMHVLEGTKGHMGKAYDAMALGFPSIKSKASFTERMEDTPDLHIPKTRSKAKKPVPPTQPDVDEDDDEDDVSEDDSEGPSEALLRRYDQGGLPPGSISSGKGLKFMAEALQGAPARTRSEAKSPASMKNAKATVAESSSNGLTSTPLIDQQSSAAVESDSSEDSSSDDSSEEEEDAAPSSKDSDDSSDSDSDDSSDSDAPSAAKPSSAEDASSSASDSSSDSSSEEEPEETSSKNDSTTHTLSNSATLSNSVTLSNSASSSFSTKAKSRSSPTVPGQGSRATKKRNERKRLANALDRYKQKGILPAGTTIGEFSELGVSGDAPSEVVSAAFKAQKNSQTTEADDFERRRQELLESLASGGIEVGDETASGPKSTASQQADVVKSTPMPVPVGDSKNASASLTAPEPEPEQTGPSYEKLSASETMDVDSERPSTAPEASTNDTPVISPVPLPVSVGPSRTETRRPKINLGAAGRMLFGSLGKKAPKTKKDEEKLRADFNKDIRHVAPKVVEPIEVQVAGEEDTSDAWREKIVYRGVECVQENIVLSEPPFPFIQRWDPQQQYSWSHNGKRKQDQRGQGGVSRPSKKQKRRKAKHNYSEEQEFLDASYEPSYQEESMELQYDDSTQLDDEHVDDEISLQLMNDITGPIPDASQEVDDCIPLPEDISTLEDLKDGDARVGMIIAYKKLDLSAATQWQPLISAYRTAVVISIQEDGTLNLNLAMRDREHTEKQYDESGNRVYGKFETVDDDDDMEEDSSFPNLTFGELIEPKVLQNPPRDYADSVANEASQDQEDIDLPDHTASAEQDSVPLSHVTETPIQSEAAAVRSDGPNSLEIKESIEMVVDETSDQEMISQNLIAESQAVENHVLTEPIISETSTAINIQEATATPAADVENTDAVRDDPEAAPRPASIAAKEQIAHLIKDTDVRTDPPSSVLRDMQFTSVQSPGEAAVLEKLLKDMTESSSKAYSPKFNGLGSSPIKKLRESSATPTASESRKIQVVDSSPTRNPDASPRRSVDSNRETISPSKPPQSSWETVESQYQTSSPPPVDQGNSSWVTEDSQLPPSSPPVPTPVKVAPAFKPLTRKVPVGRAQALWEALRPKRKIESSDSEDESSKDSAAPPVTEQQDSNANVQYPKLSVGSSFTSQTADHGRQPDFEFNEESLDAGTPTAGNFNRDRSHSTSPTPEPERQLSASHVTKLPSRQTTPGSESELELPSNVAAGTTPVKRGVGTWGFDELARNSSPPQPDPTSSDSDFLPSLEQLSQSVTIKREKSRETSMKPPRSTKTNNSAAGPSRQAAESSEDEDQTTPKASQKRQTNSQSTRNRDTALPPSQSRTAAPRPSQVVPAGSQVIDLSLSSDDEPAREPQNLVSSDHEAPPTRFRKYSLESDDDDEYKDDGETAGRSNASRRQTTGNLGASSQTSLNSRNRRQTSVR